MPDFADVDGRFLRGVFAEQDVEIDLRDLLVADGVHGEERGVHEHDLSVAGGLVLGGLLLDLLLERWGGELGDIGKIALVPRIVQTGIGGLRAAKELFFIESGRLLGFILIQGLLAGRRRGQRVPVKTALAALGSRRTLMRRIGAGRAAERIETARIGLSCALCRGAASAEELEREEKETADKDDVEEAAAIEAAAKEQRAEQATGEKAPEHTAHASEKTTARSGGVGHLLALAVGLLIERGGRIRGQRFRVGLAHGRASAEGTATADTSGVGLTIGESQHDQNQYGAETGIKRLGHDVSSGWLGRHFLPLVWVLQCIG